MLSTVFIFIGPRGCSELWPVIKSIRFATCWPQDFGMGEGEKEEERQENREKHLFMAVCLTALEIEREALKCRRFWRVDGGLNVSSAGAQSLSLLMLQIVLGGL